MCEIPGDSAEAERLYVDAVNILEKHPDDGYDVRSVVLSGLAIFRAGQGRFDDAKDLLEKALLSGRLAFGENDIRFAALQSDLGQVYMMQGKVADAESLLLSALKVQRKAGMLKSFSLKENDLLCSFRRCGIMGNALERDSQRCIADRAGERIFSRKRALWQLRTSQDDEHARYLALHKLQGICPLAGTTTISALLYPAP